MGHLRLALYICGFVSASLLLSAMAIGFHANFVMTYTTRVEHRGISSAAKLLGFVGAFVAALTVLLYILLVQNK